MSLTDPSTLKQQLPASAAIIVLLLAMMAGLLIGQLSGVGLAQISGLGDQILSNPDWKPENSFERTIYRSVALLGQVFTFLIPALVFGRLYIGKSWNSFMQMDLRPKGWQLFHGAFWIILAFPLAQYLYTLNQSIPLPSWAGTMEDSTNELIQSLLVMETPFEFLYTLLLMALAPALGEEFIFRGLVQRLLERGYGKPHLAILISAVLFSAFHMQFEGFLPRLMLGLMLGYLLYWTKSIWVPVVVHFVYNALQVAAAYFSPKLLEDAPEKAGQMTVEPYQLILSIALTFLVGYYIYRKSNASGPSDQLPPENMTT